MNFYLRKTVVSLAAVVFAGSLCSCGQTIAQREAAQVMAVFLPESYDLR